MAHDTLQSKYNFLKTKKGTDYQCLKFVGAKGFEPSTPCSQSRCASRTAPYPEVYLTLAEKGGFEPPVPLAEYDSLANCWFQPLTHLSKVLRSECGCKSTVFFITSKLFLQYFFIILPFQLKINKIKINHLIIKDKTNISLHLHQDNLL